MVTELRHLLEESVQRPPAEPHGTGTILRRARARRRRHRMVAVGSALAVVAVAGVAYGVVHELTGGTGADPVTHTAPVGPVVHPDDAVPGGPGKDVTVFASYLNHHVNSRNGRNYEQVTSDGRVLVSQATRHDRFDPLTEYTRFGLQDPATGALHWLPAPPDAGYADDHAPSGPMVVAVHGDTVVWLDRDRAPIPIDVYDLGTRAWSHFTIYTKAFPGSDDGIELEEPAVSGDRLYFVPLGLDAPLYRRTLWSVPLDGSEPPTEVTRVGDWGIDGDTLVWTDITNGPVSRVTVRNLETGKEHSFDPQSGDRCNQLSLGVAHGVIALGEYCGEKHRGRDDRVHVVTTNGRPLVTLQGSGIEAAGVSRGFVTADAYGEGAPAGTYVYDLAASRLVRISTDVGSVGRVGPYTGAGGRTLTWSVPVSPNDIKLFAGRWNGTR